MEATKKRWLVGLAGTVALGAVGSGLWDVLLKPAFWWLGRAVLTMVTLGLSSVKDNMYQDVAKGHHEVAGLYILLFVITTFVFFPLGITTGAWTARKLFSRADTIEPETRFGGGAIERLNRYRRRLSMSFLPLYALGGSILFVRFLIINYTNLAVTTFQQSFAICKPYIDPREQDQSLSRFARIKTKHDYEAVLASLDRVAKSNGLELPKFEPW